MNLTAAGTSIMHNEYQYDAVDNILGITNAVDPTRGNTNGDKKLGGAFKHSYAYDDLNRLVYASGKAKQASYSMQMTFGRMSEPLTKVQKVDSTKTAQSYDFTYKYEDSNHPTAPTQIGHEHYTYDANGNPTLVENDSLGTERRMYWDEDNRLIVLSDNGKTCRYTYNAAGERIIKSHGDLEGVYINGAPQGITFHETEDYTIYPAPIITVTKNRFTKHYFIGDKRVASKLGVGKFSNVYGISGNNVTAGQKDYAARMMQIEKQREEYYKSLGTPPGVPTMKGATADPDNTGRGYNDIIGDLGDHSVPEGWVQRPRFNEKGDVPGPPVQFVSIKSFSNNGELRRIAAIQHKAWNYRKVILLFALSETEIRIYNCYEKPTYIKGGDDINLKLNNAELLCYDTTSSDVDTLNILVEIFSRIGVDNGLLWTKQPEIRKKIDLQNRIDAYLVKSLIETAKALEKDGLNKKVIHSLLMRSLFILFLEDKGVANEAGLYTKIKSDCSSYFDILNSKEATYKLFLSDKLPISKSNYNVKILDPACGSGIFLVESYKRLIKRWKKANNTNKISFEKLKNLLLDNIYGIEIDETAIKVAAFSLYLALIDELDPKTLWIETNYQLPYLIFDSEDTNIKNQGRNIWRKDTIGEVDTHLFPKVDLIIGNPPFGTKNLPQTIKEYCSKYKFSNEYVLPFIHKSVEFCPTGEIALIFNSKVLTNTQKPYQNFRKWLFNSNYVEKVYNLSIFRKAPKHFGGQLFASVVGPVSIVYFQHIAPETISEIIEYWVPKTYIKSSIVDGVVIDNSDIKELPRTKCLNPNSKIWKVALWGNFNNFRLLKKLQKTTLKDYFDKTDNWIYGRGLNADSDNPDFVPNQLIKTECIERYFTAPDTSTQSNTKFYRKK